MTIEIPWYDLTFFCYKNGARVHLPFAEAWQLLWKHDLGYVVPTGWYRYTFEDLSDAFLLRDRNVRKAVLEFAYALHASRGTPVTPETLWDKDSRATPISKNALTARAKRWGDALLNGNKRTHLHLLPFEPVHIPVDTRKTDLGYQMKRGITWLMIVRADDPQAIDGFDWTIFHEPPGGIDSE